jgi:hypothetical protein
MVGRKGARQEKNPELVFRQKLKNKNHSKIAKSWRRTACKVTPDRCLDIWEDG